MVNQKLQPEKKIRVGPVSATIWKNSQKGKNGNEYDFYSVTLDRNFTDESGAWKSTNSYRLTDIPKAALALNKAFEYLAFTKYDE